GEAAPGAHGAGAAGDGRQQPAVLLGIELEVGVLNQDDVARGVLQADAHRAALADVDRVVVDADARVGDPCARVDRQSRAVARAVVRDDDLLLDGTDVDGAHAVDDLAYGLFLVVDVDDDRKLHRYDAVRCIERRGCFNPRSPCTPRAPSRSRSACSSFSCGLRIPGGGRDSITIMSSRWSSRRACRFPRWTSRGAMRTSSRSFI